jgi:CRP/FNR family transcriptional regulator, cyclic AMP receptor protein
MKRKRKLPFDPKVFLSKVNGGRAIADYRKDQNVYRQGDSAESVFYIQSGKVKSTVVSEQGKEAVVAVLGIGDFFGEGCLTGQPQRLSTVSAMTECVIVRIAKADVARVIHEEPAFAELFISHLLARNSRVRRTWSINCSIRARNAWHGFFYFWRILARKVSRSQSLRRSAKRPWRR